VDKLAKMKWLESELRLEEAAIRQHPDFNVDHMKDDYAHLVSVVTRYASESEYEYSELEPHLSGVDMEGLLDRVTLPITLSPDQVIEIMSLVGGGYSLDLDAEWLPTEALEFKLKPKVLKSPKEKIGLLTVARKYGLLTLTGADLKRLLTAKDGIPEHLAARLGRDIEPTYVFTWKNPAKVAEEG